MASGTLILRRQDIAGLLSFADSVEDPGELTAGLHRALAELVDRI